jgi:beta-glucosidase
VQLYTPVNEMFICAQFSAQATAGGTSSWRSDRLRHALKHIVKANVLAMQASSRSGPDAIFIQSESSEYFHAESPAAIKPAEIMNAAALPVARPQLRPAGRLRDVRVPAGQRHDAEEYHFFLAARLRTTASWATTTTSPTSTGSRPTARRPRAGEVFGYDEITRQYYDRYRLPVMHTETNLVEGPNGDEAVNWLWKQWANVLRVRNDGVPIVGFTWYSLVLDQVDWDTALREENGHVNPLGLYDLDRDAAAFVTGSVLTADGGRLASL